MTGPAARIIRLPGAPTPVTVVARRVPYNPQAVVWMPAFEPHVPAHLVPLASLDDLVWLACGGAQSDGVVANAARARELGAFFCVGCWTRKAVR